VDNIKMDLKEIGWGCMDWIEVAQDRGWWRTLVNMAMNLRAPQPVGIFLSICATGSVSRRAQVMKLVYSALCPMQMFCTMSYSEQSTVFLFWLNVK
jgi:hypothetical protein